mmetsp:Transcript_7151/g.22877  ORF Transcript_7151/g.22877 Transcript_7151/m.22877 type:complete len:249 (-) Transcript_7151:1364-2110(-)
MTRRSSHVDSDWPPGPDCSFGMFLRRTRPSFDHRFNLCSFKRCSRTSRVNPVKEWPTTTSGSMMSSLASRYDMSARSLATTSICPARSVLVAPRVALKSAGRGVVALRGRTAVKADSARGSLVGPVTETEPWTTPLTATTSFLRVLVLYTVRTTRETTRASGTTKSCCSMAGRGLTSSMSDTKNSSLQWVRRPRGSTRCTSETRSQQGPITSRSIKNRSSDGVSRPSTYEKVSPDRCSSGHPGSFAPY